MLATKRERVREAYGISGKGGGVTAGWQNKPSHTDLSPRPGPQVSDEVRNMFAIMQANMAAREARIMDALQARTNKKTVRA